MNWIEARFSVALIPRFTLFSPTQDFTGGQNPFARLKRALMADIDEESWATPYRTESRPFPRPDSEKIAVKVINDYGDEVMKVFLV